MITPEELRELLEVLSASGWKHATIKTDDFTLSVGEDSLSGEAAVASERASPSPAKPAPTVSPAPVASQEPTMQDSSSRRESTAALPSGGGQLVQAASVGIAWRSPKPNADPFVEVGSSVKKGDTLLIVEVMKLFTPIVAPIDGVVREIHIENGAMVENGTPLVTLEAIDSDA